MTKRNEFIKGAQLTLPKVKLEWCHLVEPDTEFKKSQWSVNAVLEEKMALSLKEVGFNVKYTGDRKKFKQGDPLYYFLKAYSKTHTAKGANTPPKVVDAQTNTMDGNLVGNGSICNVKMWCKYIEVDDEVKLPAYLNAVQVIELVEYNGDEGFDPVAGADDGADMPVSDMFGDQNTGNDVPF